MDLEGDGEDEDSPNSDDCQIITNTKLATAFVLESVRPEDRFVQKPLTFYNSFMSLIIK